jgi:hypothetical protein
MDRRTQQSLDHWLTTEPEWRTSTVEDEMNDWGIGFINQIDQKLQEPGYEDELEAWKEGDFEGCYETLKRLFPDTSDDQWEWIEEFVSEI